MHNSLLNAADISRVINRNAGTAGATVKGTIVDMQGYESVTFVVAFQDVVNLSVVTVKAAQGIVNDTGEMAVLAGGTGFTAAAADYDNKLAILEVVKPRERYVELQVAVATQNAPIDAAIAIRHRAHVKPRTQGSTVGVSASDVSPAEA